MNARNMGSIINLKLYMFDRREKQTSSYAHSFKIETIDLFFLVFFLDQRQRKNTKKKPALK